MNNNRKGFTLVELLAVIVILAILMVSAGAGVMATMNNSKVNTYKNEVLTFIDGANKMYSELSMSTQDATTFIKSNTCKGKQYYNEAGTATNVSDSDLDEGYLENGTGDDKCAVATHSAMCVTVSGLVANGYVDKEIGNYAGVILVEVPYDGGATKYIAWLHNSTYGINGVEKNMINKLKFQKTNNTEKSKGTKKVDTTKINGGNLGVVTDLTGIKLMVAKAYGSGESKDVVKKNSGTGDILKASKNELYAKITSSNDHGGTGNFYYLPCVNTKLD